MLNWTVEQCLAMTEKAEKLTSEIQHEADTIMLIIEEHPQLVNVYGKRMVELVDESKCLVALMVGIGHCAMKQIQG